MKLSEALELLKVMRAMLASQDHLSQNIGICSNIPYDLYICVNKWLYGAFKSWPKYSGRSAFPVPGDYRIGVADKWVGEQGALRLELVAHIVAELERCIRKTKKSDFYQQRKNICKALRKNNRKPFDPSKGLCYGALDNIPHRSRVLWYATKRNIFLAWPEYSGDITYPVNGRVNYEWDTDNGNMYTGESGRLRRSLARFIVAHYKAEQMAMEVLS